MLDGDGDISVSLNFTASINPNHPMINSTPDSSELRALTIDIVGVGFVGELVLSISNESIELNWESNDNVVSCGNSL